MGRKSDKGGKGGIGLEDIRLWKAFTRDIEPFEERNWDAIESGLEETAPQNPTPSTPLPPPDTRMAPSTARPVAKQPPQLDGKTDWRLKRGRIPIEGRLDLHGYNQEQAYRLLHDFVKGAHGQGKRCLLVITGKGGGRFAGFFGKEGQEGVLKQKLPQWLSDHPLRDMVLKHTAAAPKDGGGGAFYLYLKRTREPL